MRLGGSSRRHGPPVLIRRTPSATSFWRPTPRTCCSPSEHPSRRSTRRPHPGSIQPLAGGSNWVVTGTLRYNVALAHVRSGDTSGAEQVVSVLRGRPMTYAMVNGHMAVAMVDARRGRLVDALARLEGPRAGRAGPSDHGDPVEDQHQRAEVELWLGRPTSAASLLMSNIEGVLTSHVAHAAAPRLVGLARAVADTLEAQGTSSRTTIRSRQAAQPGGRGCRGPVRPSIGWCGRRRPPRPMAGRAGAHRGQRCGGDLVPRSRLLGRPGSAPRRGVLPLARGAGALRRDRAPWRRGCSSAPRPTPASTSHSPRPSPQPQQVPDERTPPTRPARRPAPRPRRRPPRPPPPRRLAEPAHARREHRVSPHHRLQASSRRPRCPPGAPLELLVEAMDGDPAASTSCGSPRPPRRRRTGRTPRIAGRRPSSPPYDATSRAAPGCCSSPARPASARPSWSPPQPRPLRLRRSRALPAAVDGGALPAVGGRAPWQPRPRRRANGSRRRSGECPDYMRAVDCSPGPGAGAVDPDGPGRRGRQRLFAGRPQRSPIAGVSDRHPGLLFEDLHWADSGTLDLSAPAQRLATTVPWWAPGGPGPGGRSRRTARGRAGATPPGRRPTSPCGPLTGMERPSTRPAGRAAPTADLVDRVHRAQPGPPVLHRAAGGAGDGRRSPACAAGGSVRAPPGGHSPKQPRRSLESSLPRHVRSIR